MDISEQVSAFSLEPEDEYDKALVFALKKWIADEINNISDSGVYACAVCWHMGEDDKGRWGVDVSFAYNTESYLKAHIEENPETKWNFCAWKDEYFGTIDKDEAVSGSLDIWLDFKGFDVNAEDFDEDKAAESFFRCAARAVTELRRDGIIKERFNRDIPILMCCGLEGGEETAVYSAAANGTSLLDGDFFERYY